MKNLLKGVAITVVVLIVLMVINVFCNMHDINLDPIKTGPISAVCAMFIYNGLTKNDKNKNDQGEKK